MTGLKKTWSGICFTIFKTWKYEKAVILLVLIQGAIGISVPFISIYLPAVLLDGMIGTIGIKAMLIRLGGLIPPFSNAIHIA